MYIEDVDLCWRLRHGGWRVGYEPGGVVMHVQGASTSQHPYRMITEHHRSLWRFASKRVAGARRLAAPARGGVPRGAGRARHGRPRPGGGDQDCPG